LFTDGKLRLFVTVDYEVMITMVDWSLWIDGC